MLCFVTFLLLSSVTGDVSAEDCFRMKLGRGYNGRVNVTVSGRDCQPWGSHIPHAHNFTWLWTEENFCRNPDDRADGPWCYTMDPETALESCGITQCTTKFDPCMMKPCQNGGKCRSRGVTTSPYYSCVCDAKWTGQNCQTKVSQCQFKPCKNGATCIDLKEDFMCLCTTDYVGKICDLKIGLCDTENGWQRFGSNCYRLINDTKASWNDAINLCGEFDASLTVIDSPEIQTEANDFAKLEKTDFWTGISNDNSVYFTRNYYSSEHLELNITNFYWHKLQRSRSKNGLCVMLKYPDNKHVTDRGNWFPIKCSSLNNVVCSKPVGTCPRGWFFHVSKCYKMLDDWQSTWRKASDHCKTLNSNLLEITSDAEQNFMQTFLQRQRSGIGNDGKFWLNLRRQSAPVQKYWAWESSKHKAALYTKLSTNTTELGECVYMDIDRNGTWLSDDLCSASFGVVCSYDVGSRNWIANKEMDTHKDLNDRESSCGKGWIDWTDGSESSCFFLITELLTWEAAENKCQQIGGHLISIDDNAEQAFIAGLLRFEAADGSVWIGANCREEGAGYQWTDGEPFVYYNWFPDEPDHVIDGDEDCVAMFISNAKWTDRPCGQLHPGICEKSITGTSDSETKSNEIQKSIVVDGYCPNGWVSYKDNCFLIKKNTTTWDEADSICRRQGADLASISDRLEQYLVFSQLSEDSVSVNYGFWIGLRDRKDQTFRWADDNDVTYVKWQSSEPQGFTPYKQGCTYISFYNGLWADKACESYMPGYVCKMKKQRNGAGVKLPFSEGCDRDYVGYESFCYKVFTTPKTWDGADTLCKSNNGSLATISSLHVSSFLASHLGDRYSVGLMAWIGYSANQNKSSWSSGKTPLLRQTFLNFATNSSRRCGFLHTSLLLALGLCQEKHYFICEKQRTGYLPVSSSLPLNSDPKQDTICPQGWYKHNNYCYKEFLQTLPWTKARKHCRSLGGRLVSTQDERDVDFVYNTFKDIIGTDWWVGYNRRDSTGVWHWSDSPENQFSPLNTGSGIQNCALMFQSNGMFKQDSCILHYPYVCEVQSESSVLSYLDNKTLEKCDVSGFFLHDKFCYSINETKMSYVSAQRICQMLGSELASIHSNMELEFILSLQKNYDFENELWIGLRKVRERGIERWQWSDNSSLDFAYWRNNELTTSQRSKDCTVLFSIEGKWEKRNCLTERGFICKKETLLKKSPSSSAVKSEFIVGGCPLPYVSSPINNKCYLLNETQTTWQTANTTCFSLGGSLLTIQNQLEQDYILSLVNLKTPGLWIDLNRLERETFRNQNNKPLLFTNWDRDQPKSQQVQPLGLRGILQYKEDCVQMYTGTFGSRIGRWNVKSCAENNAFFICEKPKDSFVPNNKRDNDCPRGYEQFGKNCYMYHAVPENFDSAQKNCQSNNGSLVSVTSVYEYGFVRGMTAQANLNSHWIGLRRSNDTVLYRWTDGNPYMFSHWNDSKPSQQPNEECVVSLNGMWMDVPCTKEYPYLCEINSVKAEMRSPPKCMPLYGIAYDGACYYVQNQEKDSWKDARQKCKSHGMDLVSIQSAKELETVQTIVARMAQAIVWIGLTNARKASDMFQNRVYWYWSSGEEVSYTNWGDFEPSENILNSDDGCVYMDTTGFWHDDSCSNEYAFICKHTGSFSDLKTIMDNSGKSNDSNPHSQNNQIYRESVESRRQSHLNQSQDPKTNNTSAIVGVAVGVSILIILIIAVVIFVRYKKKYRWYPRMSLGFSNAMYRREIDESY